MKTTRVTNASSTPIESSPLHSHSNSAAHIPRVSWYYEENGDRESIERQTSVTVRTRLLSTDSTNKSMIKTIIIREGDASFTSEI